jgi:hypothetical protein
MVSDSNFAERRRGFSAANRTQAVIVANRLLGQDPEPVAILNSLRPIDQAQNPGTPKR